MCLAIPGKILEVVSESDPTALVDVAGVRRRVNLALIKEEGPVPGDWVLIHVGFALSKISAQDAADQQPDQGEPGHPRVGLLVETGGVALDDGWIGTHLGYQSADPGRDLRAISPNS